MAVSSFLSHGNSYNPSASLGIKDQLLSKTRFAPDTDLRFGLSEAQITDPNTVNHI